MKLEPTLIDFAEMLTAVASLYSTPTKETLVVCLSGKTYSNGQVKPTVVSDRMAHPLVLTVCRLHLG